MKRRLKHILLFLFLGLLVTLGVAAWLAVHVDVATGPTVTASRGDWTVTAQWATGALRVTSERVKPPWCPTQATGAPDTPQMGDFRSAWAAATSNGSSEWLEVEFDKPYSPKFIDVYENNAAGAVTLIVGVLDDGKHVDLWGGVDPTPRGSTALSASRFEVAAAGAPAVRKVRVQIGRPDVQGWTEIDAVGLIDADGQTHWAVDATASSWYGQGSYGAGGAKGRPEELAPGWSGLRQAERASETVAVEARGWPMLALWTPTEEMPAVAMSGLMYSGRKYPVLSGPTIPPKRAMPYRPIALGLAVDSAAYGIGLAVAWAVMTRPRRFFAEVSRMKRGCCVRCGYDLGYDFARGCSECGWRRESRLAP